MSLDHLAVSHAFIVPLQVFRLSKAATTKPIPSGSSMLRSKENKLRRAEGTGGLQHRQQLRPLQHTTPPYLTADQVPQDVHVVRPLGG